MDPLLNSLGTISGPALASVILPVAIAIAAYFYQLMLQKLPSNVRSQIDAIASTVVQAIEQQYGQSAATGRQKKQEAMDIMSEICLNMHLPINIRHVSAAIESAVYMLNRAQNKIPADEQPTAVTPSVKLPPPSGQ